MLVFANPEVQKLLREKFVTVAGDDWYQRQKKGDEGRFYRKVVEQGPRKGSGTRQGHYVFTAQGELLGFNNNRGPGPRLAMIREALIKWEKLPAERKTGMIYGEAKGDGKYQRKLPEGGRVVKVYTRALQESKGRWVALSEGEVGTQAAVDHLWLRKEEIQEIQKLIARGGGNFPDWFSMRVAKFHLRDNTRGEPEDWEREHIKSWELKVDSSGGVAGRFELQKEGGRLGFEGRIKGEILFKGGRLTKFEWLVLGGQWGDGAYTRGSRPGKTPLGQVFQLTDAQAALDQIPPQGIRWEQGYWQAGD